VSAALQGTAAVVTGASSGIGQAIAVAMAEAGVADIVVHYCRNAGGAEQTCRLLAQAGCRATMLSADLAVESDRNELAREAFARLGTIHTWVHNAGADVLTGDSAHRSFEEKLDRLWEVDVRGTILLARLIASRMEAQSTALPPSMVFIGWDQAPRGMEGDAGMLFGPIKASIMAFAASLSQSLAPKVRVNCVAPGWIQTSWGNEASEYWDRRAKTQALMNRWGTPQDIARAVLYVTDPANSFLTGQTIDVNGGWNRRGEMGE
jgi:3-oxoacyl-[acyl-carrier protein] reductase